MKNKYLFKKKHPGPYKCPYNKAKDPKFIQAEAPTRPVLFSLLFLLLYWIGGQVTSGAIYSRKKNTHTHGRSLLATFQF